ncbi:unnamed protein product [Rotaria sp. Silwood2]|nr:unnamed protein product [Rotaria sp. Silwood2]CAF2759380.1 unnamed protein product [Rotaria sp. Silwood2]CAF2993149.1 unnamed protein product [Rotaria sp. Silwood2]CAF3169645.1 unnamed protein product [Rotaria sp. Silwood2]CAF4119111.1 unnamed protein product [Rotaria sp. Silwood2]
MHQKFSLHSRIFFFIADHIHSLPRGRWKQDAVKVAGSHQHGSRLNELYHCCGLYVDTDGNVLIADSGNHRIVEWKPGAMSGQVVAGGNGPGNAPNQLNAPSDVIVDKNTNSLLICDKNNRRVVLWARRHGREKEMMIKNTDCYGLTMDDRGFLYVTDIKRHEV